jgi:hypothetical protein
MIHGGLASLCGRQASKAFASLPALTQVKCSGLPMRVARDAGTRFPTYMVALYAIWYNFVRIHKTLRTSPAMAAGIEKRLWSMEDVVGLIDARSAKIGGDTLIG